MALMNLIIIMTFKTDEKIIIIYIKLNKILIILKI